MDVGCQTWKLWLVKLPCVQCHFKFYHFLFRMFVENFLFLKLCGDMKVMAHETGTCFGFDKKEKYNIRKSLHCTMCTLDSFFFPFDRERWDTLSNLETVILLNTFENTHWRKVEQMQPVWVWLLWSKFFEVSYEITQWRRVKQMQPVQLRFLSSSPSEDTFNNTHRRKVK